MTTRVGSETNWPRDETGDVLSRVWQLDATSDEAAVRRYVREMAEAEALLDSVDLDNVPLLVPYSASWPEGSVR